MKYVTYKGAIYSKANERIRELRAKNRPYSLTTEEVQLQIENFLYWKVKATLVILDTSETFTGCAMRRLEKDNPFGSYPLEWAETVATARAIGKMGIGIDYWYACLEELAELDRAEVKDREGDVPAITLTDEKEVSTVPEDVKQKPVTVKEAFTAEDMKATLGDVTVEAPVQVDLTNLPGNSSENPAMSRADILAARLKAKQEEREEKKADKKGKKKSRPVPIDPEPEIVLPSRPPDKYDNVLQSIESQQPMPEDDPIFGKAFQEGPEDTDDNSEDLEIINID